MDETSVVAAALKEAGVPEVNKGATADAPV